MRIDLYILYTSYIYMGYSYNHNKAEARFTCFFFSKLEAVNFYFYSPINLLVSWRRFTVLVVNSIVNTWGVANKLVANKSVEMDYVPPPYMIGARTNCSPCNSLQISRRGMVEHEGTPRRSRRSKVYIDVAYI